MVSVCIPTYNQEKYISLAIEGVLSQKNCEYEIIIANDGSSDNTGKICENYRIQHPDKIKLINQVKNKGLVKNTQDCLLAACGEYIAICEGDDYWIDEYKLAKQVEILKNNKDVSLVHTRWTYLSMEYLTFSEAKWNYNKNYISEQIYGKESVREILNEEYRGTRFSTILFRKEVLNYIYRNHKKFFSDKFPTLDIGFFYCSANYGKIYALNEITTVYRVEDGSVSVNSNKSKHYNYWLGIFNINTYFLKEFQFELDEFRKLYNKNVGRLIKFQYDYYNKADLDKLIRVLKENNYRIKFYHSLLIYGAKINFIRKNLNKLLNIYSSHYSNN